MKILSFVFAVLTSTSIFAGISVVSDLDDTIKITNAGAAIEATINGVFTKNVYTGMPLFLKNMQDYTTELSVLTGSPSFLRPQVKGLMKKHDIDAKRLILRNVIKDGETYKYKVARLKELLKNSTDDFILIGDDVDKDPEAYATIKEQFPNRIVAIYIHAIRNRTMTSEAIRYWTSFDLTLHEIIANRMDASKAQAAVDVLLSEKKLTNVFPKFADCPSEATVWDWQVRTVFETLAVLAIEKLTTFCQNRTASK